MVLSKKSRKSSPSRLTYSSVGIDRTAREKLRSQLERDLAKESEKYETGSPIRLPFGTVFSSSPQSSIFIDFQIEGVGTKTLLAELEPSGYSTIGIDAVAMAANDLIRSGARPLFVSDAIHIAKSRAEIISKILSGVVKGAELCGAIVASGETGDVREILHSKARNNRKNSEPFDLFVSCCGFGDRRHLIMGGIEEGDAIIGIESSGIHSNGLSLARRVLLSNWGGKFDPYDQPSGLGRPVIKELLEPTRIYAKAINELSERVQIKAAVHITGDGYGKFYRLASFNMAIPNGPWGKDKKPGFEFENLGESKQIFRLIYETARKTRNAISLEEMYRTFNMGYGFAVIVNSDELEQALDLFNRYLPSKWIGRVTSTGKVKIKATDFVRTGGAAVVL